MIVVGVWAGMPQTTIALLAGVQSIREDLHEAAAVDGATAWQRFRTITLPQLRPVIVAITTLDFIWNFNSFGLVYVLTLGGPGHKTELPMLFAYNEAFKYGEFGYASALGDAMVLVIACSLVFYLWGRLKETSSAAMIVSSHPKAARTGQYVAMTAYMLFLAFPLLWLLVDRRSRATRELYELHPVADPAPADARRATTSRSPRTACCTRRSQSFKVATATAIITTVIALPAAYVLARQRGLIAKAGLGWILLSQMFPLILIIIPLFLLLRNLHLADSQMGLVFVYVVWTLPFILWMLQSYVRGIPARPRGGGGRRRGEPPAGAATVIAPLLAPGIIVTSLFAFIQAWNEFFFALVLLQTPDKATLPLTAGAVRRRRGHRPARPAGREHAARDHPEPRSSS